MRQSKKKTKTRRILRENGYTGNARLHLQSGILHSMLIAIDRGMSLNSLINWNLFISLFALTNEVRYHRYIQV